jgi:hypothetical protein
MTCSLIFLLGLSLGQQPTASGMHQLTADIPGVGQVLYAISIPKGYDASRQAPLVLVLHSGGERSRYYGAAYARLLVEPALRDWQPRLRIGAASGRCERDDVGCGYRACRADAA